MFLQILSVEAEHFSEHNTMYISRDAGLPTYVRPEAPAFRRRN